MQLTDIVGLVAARGATRFAEKRGGVMLPLTVGAMLPGIAERALERSRSTERTLSSADHAKIAAGSFPGLAEALKRMAGGGGAQRPMGGSGGMTDFRRFDPMMGFPSPPKSPPKPFQPPAPFPGTSGGGQMPLPTGMMSLLMSAAGNKLTQQGGEGFGDSVKGLAASPLKGVSEGISGGIGESIKRMMVGREFGERKDPLHLGGAEAVKTLGKGIGEMGVDLLRDMADKAMTAVGHAGDSAAREAIVTNLKSTDPVLSSADDKTLMEAYHTMTRFAPVLSTDKNAVRSFLRQAVMSGSGPDYMSIKLLADAERAVTGGNKKD